MRKPAARADATAARRTADEVSRELAAGQHGIVTRAQLAHAGVPLHVVDLRVHRRVLRPIHAGVYQVGPLVSPRAREMAALLACDGVAISHRSAAVLCELTPQRDNVVHVIVKRGHQTGRRTGICAHRCRIGRDEITRIDGIPVTTLARTLLDFSNVASARELEQAFARAERSDAALRRQLAALLRRYPGRAGTSRLRRLLDDTTPPFTRSEAEERLLALIRAAGLPVPQMNVKLHGYEVDCYWKKARLVVEVDGYAWHASAHAFLRDRRRDSALAAQGIQVLRLSWQQIVRESERTLVQLAQALARVQP